MTITNLGLFKERFTKLRDFNNKTLLIQHFIQHPSWDGRQKTHHSKVTWIPSPKFLTFRTSFLAKFCPSSFFSPPLLSTEYVHLGPPKKPIFLGIFCAAPFSVVSKNQNLPRRWCKSRFCRKSISSFRRCCVAASAFPRFGGRWMGWYGWVMFRWFQYGRLA